MAFFSSILACVFLTDCLVAKACLHCFMQSFILDDKEMVDFLTFVVSRMASQAAFFMLSSRC